MSLSLSRLVLSTFLFISLPHSLTILLTLAEIYWHLEKNLTNNWMMTEGSAVISVEAYDEDSEF